MSIAGKIQDLITELGNNDPKLADNAGRAILSLGPTILPTLFDALQNSNVAVRRRIAFLLGELGRETTLDIPDIKYALLTTLNDDDWKARRNAAISLGKFGDNSVAQPILRRLDIESDPRVRASLILSFGKVAEPGDACALTTVQLTTDDEQNAARKVKDRFSVLTGSVPAINTDVLISPDVAVELWSRHGLSEIVALEVSSNGIDAKAIASDRIAIRSAQNLKQLLNTRSALYPVLTFEVQNHSASPRELGKQFSKSSVAAEMVRLTEGTPIAYRLSVGLQSSTLPRRRDWINDFAAGVSLLENRATGYSWEVIVKPVKGKLLLGARPTACSDDRFAYRKEDVPASLHPTLAAAAVRLAPSNQADVVADPFCGSGTLLAERALIGPYKQMFGLDIDPMALKAAHTNLADFERINLKQSDFAQISKLGSFDLIITNPPYGQRVGNIKQARRLHSQLDDLASKALRPGGCLVVFRPPSFPSPTELKVIKRSKIDAGGLQVDLVLALKRS